MCSRSTRRSPADLAASDLSATDGGPAGERHIRSSDAEREQAVNQLREHAGAGRLSTDELAARVETALAARARGELEELFEDLPAERPPQRGRARAKVLGARIHAGAYLWASLAMIVIWLATGAGYFWPVWPMLGWGIGVVSHGRACGVGIHLARRQP